MRYHFFLSYARGDKDIYLENFFKDLCHEVKLLIPNQIDKIGFKDEESIQLGDNWSTKLTGALKECKVFVALCSPTYFSRTWCGKEWHFFNERIDESLKLISPNIKRPPLIIPILWIPQSLMPTCAAKYQNTNVNLGELYEEEGLRYLSKLEPKEYVKCVAFIAKTIVDVAEIHTLPVQSKEPVLGNLRNAFDYDQSNNLSNDTLQPQGGPRLVQFVYIVGDNKQMGQHRDKLESYGKMGAQDWKPFSPPMCDLIMLVAQKASSDAKFIYDKLEFNHDSENDLVKKIREAEKQNKIVIMILDIWTLNIDQFQATMRRYDEARFVNSAVLVPWNIEDSETIDNAPLLEDMLRKVLYRQSATVLRTGIQSPEKLVEEIRIVLDERCNKIIEFSKVHNKLASDYDTKLPLLRGN